MAENRLEMCTALALLPLAGPVGFRGVYLIDLIWFIRIQDVTLKPSLSYHS